jgi:hypothetical protein
MHLRMAAEHCRRPETPVLATWPDTQFQGTGGDAEASITTLVQTLKYKPKKTNFSDLAV